MYVHIGPYRRHIQASWFVGWLEKHLSEDRYDAVEGKLQNAINYIWNNRVKRKEKVIIHGYDAWNADGTLSLVILPLLREVERSKQGAPNVDDLDVPDELKSTSASPKKNDWDVDDNHFKRWDHVLKEMIWAFEQKCHPDGWDNQFYLGGNIVLREDGSIDTHDVRIDHEGMNKHQDRISNGLRLFGKYFECLWT